MTRIWTPGSLKAMKRAWHGFTRGETSIAPTVYETRYSTVTFRRGTVTTPDGRTARPVLSTDDVGHVAPARPTKRRKRGKRA